jgi:hypothetical protein
MPPAMISVGIRHALKCFYFGVHVLNNYPFPRMPCIVSLFAFIQFMIFAFFYGYPTVLVEFFYPKVPKVRVYQDGGGNRRADGVLIYLEIVDAAFSFLDINDFLAFPVDDYLRF